MTCVHIIVWDALAWMMCNCEDDLLVFGLATASDVCGAAQTDRQTEKHLPWESGRPKFESLLHYSLALGQKGSLAFQSLVPCTKWGNNACLIGCHEN